MENKVLTIEQMQELIDMGIDISSASCIWWNFADLGFALMLLNDGRESLTIEKMKENHGAENIVPAFTLQDILDMLPRAWEIGAYNANRNTITVFLDDETGHCHQEVSDSLLEAAFNMLKWCKQNNYL